MLEGYDKQKIAGCFGFGCLLMIGLFALGGFGAYYGIKTFVQSAVFKYTEPVQVILPRDTLSAQESLVVNEKLERFSKSLTDGTSSEPLELTAKDVNYLISSSPEPIFRELKDKVYVKFKNGKIESELSVPLERTGLRDLRGRYLNGKANISLGMKNGEMDFNISSLNANGFPVPANVLQVLQKRTDMLDRVFSHPRFLKYSKYLENVEIVGDRVRIVLKEGQSLEALQREMAGDAGL